MKARKQKKKAAPKPGSYEAWVLNEKRKLKFQRQFLKRWVTERLEDELKRSREAECQALTEKEMWRVRAEQAEHLCELAHPVFELAARQLGPGSPPLPDPLYAMRGPLLAWRKWREAEKIPLFRGK